MIAVDSSSVPTAAQVAAARAAGVQAWLGYIAEKPNDDIADPWPASAFAAVRASGLLTGKFRRGSTFAADDHRNFNRQGQAFDVGETFSGVDYNVGLEAVEEMRALLPTGVSMSQFALRWILMFDAVTCAIPGGKRAEQVAENCRASDLPPLTDEVMTGVRRIYDEKIRPLVQDRW